MTRKTKVFWGGLLVFSLAALGLLFSQQLEPPPPNPTAPREQQRERPSPTPEAPGLEVPAEPNTGARRPERPPQVLPRMLPNPQPARLSAVDELLDQMEVARIAFNAPDSINVDQTAVIHLVLGVAQKMDELKERIEAEGEQVGAQVRVSSQMEARLTGASFAITAITPEVQAISGTQTTEWKWEVEPKRVGSHSLHLTLSAIVTFEDTSVSRAIRTFDRVIQVEVTWPQRVGGFVRRNWQWLWAAILVPVATWFWRRRKRSETSV